MRRIIQSGILSPGRPFFKKNTPQKDQSPPSSTHLEIRYPELWTRAHLEWFHIGFDHNRFYEIQLPPWQCRISLEGAYDSGCVRVQKLAGGRNDLDRGLSSV
jgi:hypothetical protein